MKRKYLVWLGAFVLPMVFLFQGCLWVSGPGGPGSGAIMVDWSFEGAQACPSDVSRVVVRVSGLPDAIVPCEEGRHRFPDLAPGVHTVHLKGIIFDGAGDVVTWESADVNVDVIEGREVVAEVDLRDVRP